MVVEIKIPSPGESIADVEISGWLVEDGEHVEKDQEIAEVESEKATLPLLATESGTISIVAKAGTTLAVGSVACTIDTGKKGKRKASGKQEVGGAEKQVPEPARRKESPPATRQDVRITPLARKMMQENDLSVQDVEQGMKRIGSKEVELAIGEKTASQGRAGEQGTREAERKKMSRLRKKLSERLVSVRNQTAMLTTFNEVDMSEIIRLRRTYQDAFIQKHGIKLGFMSFFTKAATEALLLFPNVNSSIDGEDIVTFRYVDIGIAVQTDKGLMVPVIRNTETRSLAELETAIAVVAEKARNNRISMDEMTGGTFTITNGGVFGSMLSTPILNPPQAAILGMHNIVERPVAIEGKVEIRPMMYLALSYDHRIIDGRDSVSFLVKVREFIEAPLKMLFEGNNADNILLGI